MTATTRGPALLGIRADLLSHGLGLRRAWPRSPEHLLLHAAAGHGEPPGWTAGQWFADEGRAADVARRCARAQHLPGTGVVLQPAGADHRLPGLPTLLQWPGARLVAHRPGRRAVVRLDRPGTDPHWAKVVRPGRAAGLARTASWRPAGVTVPEVLDVDEATGIVVTADLPGTTLRALASADDRVAAWRATGAMLARVHAAPAPEGAPVHALDDEVAVSVRWLRLARSLGALPPWAVARLEGVVVEHAAAAGAPAVPVTLHRDLHDGQVLVRGTRECDMGVGVLDLDLVARGDAAVDLGNVLAHLVLRALQGDTAAAGETAWAFLEGYRGAGGALPADRSLTAHVGLAAARLAAVYGFRPAAAGGPGDDPDAGGARVVAGLVALALDPRPAVLAAARA
ncbi:phosphotransferase [Aquipuribacter nitratireducens]|uniref:Phosphotransferase n=1 Tax=Aquipuribacter nitratireducens TaxID=650104 RepID=A0ABW0GLE7_9MICO